MSSSSEEYLVLFQEADAASPWAWRHLVVGFCGWIDFHLAFVLGRILSTWVVALTPQAWSFRGLRGRSPMSVKPVLRAGWELQTLLAVREQVQKCRLLTSDSSFCFRMRAPLQTARPASDGMPHFRLHAPGSLQLCPHPLQRVTGESATMWAEICSANVGVPRFLSFLLLPQFPPTLSRSARPSLASWPPTRRSCGPRQGAALRQQCRWISVSPLWFLSPKGPSSTSFCFCWFQLSAFNTHFSILSKVHRCS